MAVKSTIKSHKKFDLRVKLFVGEETHTKFLALGIKINHIKKICMKLKGSVPEAFKKYFLKACNILILGLEAGSQKITSGQIKKKISQIFSSGQLHQY